MRHITFILLFAGMLVSCNGELLQEQENIKPAAPALEKTNGNAPAQSGYFVTRGGQTNAFIFIDHDAGLTGMFAVDAFDFCDPFPNFDAFQLIPTQQVDIPNDPLRLHVLQHGEVFFQIFDGVINPNEFLCSFINENPLLAEGMSSTILTDNDLVIFARDNPRNRNAYGFTSHGTLYDNAGDPVNFRAVYRGTWDGVDYNSIREVVRIRLN